MKISVTGRHTVVTASLRDFAVRKVSKLEEYFENLKMVHVILSVEKYRHTAEIFLQFAGRDLSAKKTTKDMYASVEEAIHALSLQAAKLKDKLSSKAVRKHSTAARTIRKPRAATAGEKEATPPKASRKS